MKERIFILLIALFTAQFASAQQRSCHSNEYLQQQLQSDPDRQARMNAIEKQTKIYINNHAHNHSVSGIITIPVVVHVVYENNTQNISESQIQSQIDVLNLDFRRLNTDANNTWPQADDIEIEFCMATVDPNGNATNGITRTSTNNNVFTDDDKVKFTNQGGRNAWDPTQYMNMWVCELDGFLGYAQFPGGPVNTDGVVCDYRYFGTNGTAAAPFDLGRTATHEVGHYLNLYHIWGDGGCGVDDNVNDTPASDAANYGCASNHSSCGSVDMVQNYMDYSDDACMNLFTTGQKNRMRALFETGGERESLLNSTACGGGGGGGTTCDAPTGINNNAGNTNVTISWTAASNAQSYDVQYRPTGGTWTTNSNINGTSHTINNLTNCTTYDIRVRTDCGSENSSYSAISNFSTTGCSSGCNDNSATLTIVPDDYGSEITWEIKNGNTVLYSGGPYTDGNTTPVVVDLCLVDGCFDFVINDSYGDGICCAEGNGSYTVTDGNGATLITGGNFGSTETKNFCVGSTPPPSTCDKPFLKRIRYPSNNTRVILYWSPVSGANSYNIRYKEIGTTTFTTVSSNNAFKALNNLSPTKSYQVQVSTQCSNGTSSWSPVYKFSRNLNLCSNSTNVSAINSVTSNSARIYWHKLANATQYRFQYRAVGTSSWTNKYTTANNRVVSNLSAGTEYYVRVRAKCSGSWRPWSGTYKFSTSGNSSREINEEVLVDVDAINLNVYPNPTNGIVNIATENISENASIRIFSTMGKLVRELPKASRNSNLEINLGDLPEGIYIIKLDDGNQSITKKLSLVKY